MMNSMAATIPILIVVLSAIAALLAEAIRHPGERMYIAGFGLIGLVGAALASCFLWDTDAISFGVVRADNFALFINIILCIIGIMTMVFSHDVIEREGLPAGEYYALTLFAISGMMLMAAATDLLVIFLALETMSIAVYVLTGIRRDQQQSTEAAFKYFLLGAFASSFFLYGIAFLYGTTGTTNLDEMSTRIAAQSMSGSCFVLAGRFESARCAERAYMVQPEALSFTLPAQNALRPDALTYYVDLREWRMTPRVPTVDVRTALRRFDDVLPRDRTLVTDGGRFMYEAWRSLHVRAPAHFLPTVHFGSIGLGLPTAIGARYGAPGRPVVLVTGDGGFMLGGLAEFSTAVREGVDLTVIVLNDGGYGAEHIQFRTRDMDPGLSLFAWPDLAAVAAAMGGVGVRVRRPTDLDDAAAALAGRERPVLLDVHVDPDLVPNH